MLDSLLETGAHGIAGVGIGTMLVYLLVMTQLTTLTVTLYLHRGQTHHSVDYHPALMHWFRFWIWLTTAMITREWVAVHRKHHAHSDKKQDPHSPQVAGIGTVLGKGTELYIKARNDEELLTKYGLGTPNDWLERHLYTPHCNWGPTLLAVTNLLLFGVLGMAIWAVQMMWIPFWGGGVINGLGHWWGYRNFETADRSANLFPWALWIGGEELHNNHHAFPGSAKFSIRRHEFDLGWLAIQILARCRLADVKRIASGHTGRASITSIRQPQQTTLAPRVRVMTDFFRKVMLPAIHEERRSNAGHKLPPRLHRALAGGGRCLADDDRRRLNDWLDTRPQLHTLWKFRTQLAALMDQRGLSLASEGFSRWVSAAEVSGIDPLRIFAQSLLMDMGAAASTRN